MSLLAFPSAIGAGAYVTGGRGGKICKVDNLTWNTSVVYDSVSDTYSGGFYNMFYELDIPAKIIIFEVSGRIILPEFSTLDYDLKTYRGNITVLGQTSPNGIRLETGFFKLKNIRNLIWRYTTFARNDSWSGFYDALSVDSAEFGDVVDDIIFDHCGFFYGGDEDLSIAASVGRGSVDRVTVQNCLHGAASKGNIIGSYEGETDATFSYNAWVDVGYRFPNTVSKGNGRIDIYNNYSENYGSRLIRTSQGGKINVINNFYRANRADFGRNQMQYKTAFPISLWSSGNIRGTQTSPVSPDFDENWEIFAGSDIPENDPIPNDARALSAFELVGEPSTIYDALDVGNQILGNVGNTLSINENGQFVSNNNDLDEFYIDLAINPITTSDSYRYPTVKYPAIQSSTPFTSTLNDGIPDAWRSANMNGQSATDISPNGYSWIEVYANGDEAPNPEPPDPPIGITSAAVIKLVKRGLV